MAGAAGSVIASENVEPDAGLAHHRDVAAHERRELAA